MTTLITGGGSQVGVHLARQLRAAGRDAVFASRSGKRIPEGFKGVQLDWYDPKTFDNPFNLGQKFDSAYIVGPPDTLEPAKFVIPFIDKAVKQGVKRFAYVAASLADEENNFGGLGAIPRYLKEKGIERVVVRPTWFIDNLVTMYGEDIKQGKPFKTTIPTARLPFVATEDIARAAFEGLTNDKNVDDTFITIGPELLTYDELASIASNALGKQVTHQAVSPDELVEHYRDSMGEEGARFYVSSEVKAQKGSEERWSNLSEDDQKKQNLKVFSGKTTVRDWVLRNREAFE